jgi:hypothetical protein
MRKTAIFAIAALVTAAAVPPAVYYITKNRSDPLTETLKRYGFLPIMPPSNLMQVGTLYYVNAAVTEFKAICRADKTDLQDAVAQSRSWEMQQELAHNGNFATNIKVDFGVLLGGDVGGNYVQKVHASLTDVLIDEITLGANSLIFTKLMEKPECNQVATQLLSEGAYVCQGQKILQGTARYGVDEQNKLEIKTKANADDVKNLLKTAIETQGNQSVLDKDGRLFAGTALEYGVSMNPTCLAPLNGRFARVLPQTAFRRFVNFVLFNIIEPMLPAKDDRTEVAQN